MIAGKPVTTILPVTNLARARRFYERYGFEEVGKYVFMVGNHADDDRIMRLTL